MNLLTNCDEEEIHSSMFSCLVPGTLDVGLDKSITLDEVGLARLDVLLDYFVVFEDGK